MAKRRRQRPSTGRIYPVTNRPPDAHNRKMAPPSSRGNQRMWLWVGGLAVVAALAVLGYWFLLCPGSKPAATPRPTFDTSLLHPPSATPLASPPAAPASDGTRATIETDLGNIVIELYTESAPVASENFINLAQAGFYDGVPFHRIVPGFVIQGGDPEGTGGGGPGYEIKDDPVVGDYTRGVVAMARPANPDGTKIPDSQGSQFFICLGDLRAQLAESGGYSIFGNVVEGMDVVDEIAAGEAQNQLAVDPVMMNKVTIQPGSV